MSSLQPQPNDSDPLVVADFFFFWSMFPGANRTDPTQSPPSKNAGGRRPPPPGEWNGWPWDFSTFPHDDFGPQVNYAVWVLTALAAGFLALRVYCKFLRHRGLWWDDHILIISWVSLVAQTALVSYNVSIGYGGHIWDFNPKDLQTFLLVSNTSGFFSIIAAMLSKTSFAITVLRISDGWTRRFIWFVIVSINATLGFAALSTYVQCSPTEKLWRPMLQGTCWPKEFVIAYNEFTAGYSGAMDIILALLPWRIIWKLTINKKEKLGVMIAMSMGIFAGAISFLKITQLPAINKSDLIEGIWLSILGTAETAMTIVAASIPVLRALVRGDNPSRQQQPARFMYNTNMNMTYTGATVIGRNNTTTITSRSASIPRSHRAPSLHRTRMTQRRDSGASTMSWARKYLPRRVDAADEDWLRKTADENAWEQQQPPPPPGKILQTEEVSVEWERAQPLPVQGRRSSRELMRPATEPWDSLSLKDVGGTVGKAF